MDGVIELSSFSDVQREAVVNFEGPCQVIAGAGSGKTRVLTYRIAYALSQGVQAPQVMALTFTNKAAAEMKERIAKIVGDKTAARLWMGTFHSLFSRILRYEAESLGYPPTFTIYDTADSKSLLKSVIKELQLDDNVYKVGDVQSRISLAKNNLLTAEAYNASAQIAAADASNRKPQMGRIFMLYAARCKAAGAMDFDDLLLNTNILFRDFPAILDKYRQRFKYLLVDEYQDTNHAQYLIVKKLAQDHHNLCVVGDDAQSIYSFRGARIENIQNFLRDYPNAKIFKLEENYRSTRTIVEAAGSLIEKNSTQLQKKCFSNKEEGEQLKLINPHTDQEEGYRIASEITAYQYDTKCQYSDMAILYRTNSQSRIFEDALRRRNIPYRIFGGTAFYQRAEIKNVLAYVRLIINPKDDEAFKRVVNYPARGIGDTTMGKLTSVSIQKGICLWDALFAVSPQEMGLREASFKKLVDFVRMVQSMGERVDEESAVIFLHTVVERSGIMADLQSNPKDLESKAQLENILELLNSVQEFCDDKLEENGELPGIKEFMENVALLTDADLEDKDDRNRVALMTVHQAKGLEFDFVCIPGLEENLFPSLMTSATRDGEEEERRLLYVAITRAKKKVVLSHVNSRFKWGNQESAKPSRFIREIDERYMNMESAGRTAMREVFTDDQAFERSGLRTGGIQPARPAIRRPTPPPIPKRDVPFVPTPATEIAVGDAVDHERFGKGVVLEIQNAGPDLKMVIRFELAGQKTLMMQFAKVMKLS